MTDAEPAPSCEAQFQVKVRRCNQVIMLTSFLFTFCSLSLLPCYQDYAAGDNTSVTTLGSFL
ncbi:hypothetical protein ACFLTO_00495 [Chloroflexota bacterium]